MTQKLLFITLLMACCTSLSLGQTTDEPKNEFFVGYSYHSADINTLTIDPHRTAQNGVNVAYKRNLNRNVGLKLDASAHFKRDSQQLSGGQFSSRRDQYYFLGGVEFKAASKSRVTPLRPGTGGGFIVQRTYNPGDSGRKHLYD